MLIYYFGVLETDILNGMLQKQHIDNSSRKNRKKLFPVEKPAVHRNIFPPNNFFQYLLIAAVCYLYSLFWRDDDKPKEAIEISDATEDIDDGEH